VTHRTGRSEDGAQPRSLRQWLVAGFVILLLLVLGLLLLVGVLR
jgi:hypothetical protein